ncbi:MAG TPA: metal-dependent transcriptional regulator [Candidatus Babeliaceae bacterium]|nr:metal-dependent transcriptional regulator [Candidatus Babeliaceae bacterium]
MNSLSEENYLKVIYSLAQRENVKVSITAIAEALGNNTASVIDMIKKLTEKQLVEYNKKTGVFLTRKGRNDAIQIVRKHRLWEVFLLEKLGYKWDEIHDIAEELEHITDHTLPDRLDKFLGFPEYDPHGDPIPKSNGEIPGTSKVVLTEIAKGKTCRVVAVKDTSSVFLQYLQQLGISIGTKIKVLDKIPFDNSMVIQIGKNNQTVSAKLGESVLVD